MPVEVLYTSDVPSPGEESSSDASNVSSLTSTLRSFFLTDGTPPPALPTPLTPSAPFSAPPIAPSAPPNASIGCSAGSNTPTIIVIAGANGSADRFEIAWRATRALARAAAERGNVVHHVIMSGTVPPVGAPLDDALVRRLLDLTENDTDDSVAERVHLIAGSREIQALTMVAGGASDLLAQYLQRTTIVKSLGRGEGAWFSAVSIADEVGKLPGIGVQGATGPQAEWLEPPKPLNKDEWAAALNQRWKVVARDPVAQSRAEPAKWAFWRTLGMQSAIGHASSAPQQLGALTVVGNSVSPFGTIRTRDGATVIQHSVRSCGIAWAAITWCSATARRMASPPLPKLDLTTSVSELQYDVSVTLSSLVQCEQRTNALDVPVCPWANFESSRGSVGPCIVAGRSGTELMRMIQWSNDAAPDVIMLLPEAYINLVLSDVNVRQTRRLPQLSVSGFVALEHSLQLPLRIPGVSELEQVDEAKAMGPRLWRLPLIDHRADELTAVALDKGATDALPGTLVESTAEMQVFTTRTLASDPFAGVEVRWTFAPGALRDLPTLDTAS